MLQESIWGFDPIIYLPRTLHLYLSLSTHLSLPAFYEICEVTTLLSVSVNIARQRRPPVLADPPPSPFPLSFSSTLASLSLSLPQSLVYISYKKKWLVCQNNSSSFTLCPKPHPLFLYWLLCPKLHHLTMSVIAHKEIKNKQSPSLFLTDLEKWLEWITCVKC